MKQIVIALLAAVNPCDNPAALTSQQYLTGTTGATLDPIFALGQEIKLEAHESADLAYLTFAAESREAILALAKRYRSWTLIENSFHQANIAAQTWLGKQDISNTGVQGYSAAPLGVDLFIQGGSCLAGNDRSQPARSTRVVALWYLW